MYTGKATFSTMVREFKALVAYLKKPEDGSNAFEVIGDYSVVGAPLAEDREKQPKPTMRRRRCDPMS